MYFRIGVVTFFIAIGSSATTYAQMCLDDTIRVDEVAIYSTYRQLHSIGTSTLKIDTLQLLTYRGRTLSELLQASGVNVRSYGVGGLATVAVRGGGSSHTAVVWNGINLQSPMNGGVNLSQLPVTLFNSVSVQHGGNGTMYGSGAVSGIIILENRGLLSNPNGMNVGVLYGDGNTRGITAMGKIGNPKVALSLKYNGTLADNDFEFINIYRYGNPRERISNAQAKLHGLLTDATIRFGQNTLWTLSGWITHNNKNIQTLMSSAQPSQANQLDNNFAFSSNLSHDFRNLSLRFRNAFIKANNHFVDPAAGINSLNSSKQLVNELEIKKPVTNFQDVIIGVGYSMDMALSDSYTDNVYRNKFLAYASIENNFFRNKLTLVTSIRDELVDGSLIPLVLSGGLEYKVLNNLMMRASAASSYRLPTLNDLYWATTSYAAGNPNLKPEHGWNADFGLDFNPRVYRYHFKLSSSYFFSELNDWIVWLPDSYDSYRWKPNNVSRGISQGIETFFTVNAIFENLTIKADMNYTYTSSKIFDSGDYSGKPMIYIPRHRVGANLSVLFKQLNFFYNHSFVSERFTDELNTLPYFNLADAVLGYNFWVHDNIIHVSIGVNNIWNEQYQLVRNYAMPLRNYFIRLNFEFQSKSVK